MANDNVMDLEATAMGSSEETFDIPVENESPARTEINLANLRIDPDTIDENAEALQEESFSEGDEEVLEIEEMSEDEEEANNATAMNVMDADKRGVSGTAPRRRIRRRITPYSAREGRKVETAAEKRSRLCARWATYAQRHMPQKGRVSGWMSRMVVAGEGSATAYEMPVLIINPSEGEGLITVEIPLTKFTEEGYRNVPPEKVRSRMVALANTYIGAEVEFFVTFFDNETMVALADRVSWLNAKFRAHFMGTRNAGPLTRDGELVVLKCCGCGDTLMLAEFGGVEVALNFRAFTNGHERYTNDLATYLVNAYNIRPNGKSAKEVTKLDIVNERFMAIVHVEDAVGEDGKPTKKVTFDLPAARPFQADRMFLPQLKAGLHVRVVINNIANTSTGTNIFGELPDYNNLNVLINTYGSSDIMLDIGGVYTGVLQRDATLSKDGFVMLRVLIRNRVV